MSLDRVNRISVFIGLTLLLIFAQLSKCSIDPTSVLSLNTPVAGSIGGTHSLDYPIFSNSIQAVNAEGDSVIFYTTDTEFCTVKRMDGNDIKVVAGNGYCVSNSKEGDGGLATLASLDNPIGISVVGSKIYILEPSNRIRIVDMSNGIINNLGVTGASIGSAKGMYVDPNTMNIYIADKGNSNIIKISNGIATIVVSNGLLQPTGVSLSPDGNLVISDTGNCQIKLLQNDGTLKIIAGSVCGSGGELIIPTKAKLGYPSQAFYYNSKLFILDFGNSMVKAVNNDQLYTIYSEGGYQSVRSISTLGRFLYLSSTSSIISVDLNTLQRRVVYGNYNSYYSFPSIDNPLSVFLNRPSQITKFKNSILFPTMERILKLDLTNNVLTTLAGGSKVGNDEGPSLSASFNGPSAICVDSVNAIIIVDTSNNKIRDMRGDYSVVTTTAGTGDQGFYDGSGGNAASAQFDHPSGCAVHPNKMVGYADISDTNNNVIRRISNTFTMSTIVGMGGRGYLGDGGQATNAQLNRPTGITYSSTGELYIADTGNSVIRKVGTNGIITTVAGTGYAGYNGDNISAKNARLNKPTAVYITSNNEVLIADSENYRIRKVNTDGIIETLLDASNFKEKIMGISQIGNLNIFTGQHIVRAILSGDGSCSLPFDCNYQGTCTNGFCVCNSGWNGNKNCAYYSCDSTSNHVSTCIGPNMYQCQPGWTGSTCETTTCFGVSSLTNNVCGGHGLCTDIDTCQCSSGWRGNKDCSQFSCDTPSNHATKCIGPNQYECQTGWTGTLCEIPTCFSKLPTDGSVCGGHGQCTDIDTCQCNSGWRGNKDCSQYSCDTAIPSHSHCSGPNQYQCENGWSGNNCDVQLCFGILASESNVCGGHGQCIDVNNCQCNTGWRGNDDCSQFSCDTVSKHSVKCIGPNKYECVTGWVGESCETPTCYGRLPTDVTVCGGNGQCVDLNTCQCNSGWKGNSECSKFSCDISIPPHSHCSGPNKYQCDNGWSGNNCDIHICFGVLSNESSTCSGHGQCTDIDTCQCNSGWRGNKDCSQFSCDTPSDHAVKCIGPNQYECQTGWGSTLCEVALCFNKLSNTSDVCGGHGKCIGVDSCICESGWKGNSECTTFSCDTPIAHASRCISPNKYECQTGWIGESCEIPTCFSKSPTDSSVCGGHGKCTDIDTCVCESGWHGNKDCTQFSCDISSEHAVKCIGPNKFECQQGWTGDLCENITCYGKIPTDAAVCNGNGQCLGSNTCQCNSGWKGNKECSQFSCDTPSDHAVKCIGPNQYECQTGWTGTLCEIPTCFSKLPTDGSVCGGQGQCIGVDICQCNTGWKGNSDCSQFSCDSPANHGVKCIGPNQYQCQSGWLGDLCEIYTCFSTIPSNISVCSGHGKCTDVDTCQCISGWRGSSDCSLFSCDTPSVHDSICVGPNQYKCLGGWVGDLCEIPTCGGIPSTTSEVCNSHGKCLSVDKCQCNSGWKGNADCSRYSCDNPIPKYSICSGPNQYQCTNEWFGEICTIPSCFGHPANESSACSGHGDCISVGSCECQAGWKGSKDCSQFSCDTPSSHLLNCIGPNRYQCKEGWTGPLCYTPYCHGIAGDNAKVCSEHGACVDYDTCKCKQGWSGPTCNILETICLGVLSTDENVCSAHGTCILSLCQCDEGWKGTDCSTPSCERISNCNQNGDCISNNTCACRNGYSGEDCGQKSDIVTPIVITTIIILISIIVIFCVVSFIALRYWRKKTEYKYNSDFSTRLTTNYDEEEDNVPLRMIVKDSLARFRIKDTEYVRMSKLGSGASGSVYKYYASESLEEVAVKVIEIGSNEGNELKEIVVMSELNVYENPHVVPILAYTIVEEGKYICIVMPLYDSDLRGWIYKNSKKITLEVILQIIQQISSALAFLHAKGMVHRDLKLGNIFVKKSRSINENVSIVVGDWGSTRYESRNEKTTYEGTIQYSAPESVFDGLFYPQSDIWSLGCIFYQLLTNDFATSLFKFKGTDENDNSDSLIKYQIDNNEYYISLIGNRTRLSTSCQTLLLKMICCKHKQRLSASQILERINQTQF